MSSWPAFLFLSLGALALLLTLFVVFSLYVWRLPDDKVLDYEAQAIENKRRLGIKVYRF